MPALISPFLRLHPWPDRLPEGAAARSPWVLAVGLLAVLALLLLISVLIWRRHRARAFRQPPDRLIPYLLNGAAAIPALAAWWFWVLGGISPLTPLDRGLVALAVAWMLAPFAAFGLSAAGEALTRERNQPTGTDRR